MSVPTVLIADDSPLVIRMMEKVFTEGGLAVVTAGDGLEAIEKAFAQDVSLVVLDVMMPRMNGYQACRLLKSEPATQSIPVVILTSKDQAGDRFWGLETGADYYITKDSEPQRILELVKNILAASEARPRPRPAPEPPRTTGDVLSRVNELLDRKLYEATILSEIGRVGRSLVQIDESFTSAMNLVARVIDFTVGAMAFVEADELDVVMVLHRPAAPGVIEEAKARLLDTITRQRSGAAFARVRARMFTPADGGAGGAQETTLGAFASFPIVTSGALSGLLALTGKGVARLSGETQAFLDKVAHQAYIVMENSRLVERLRNLAIRDSLTDLYNHRHSVELVAKEFDRVGRYEGGVSALMIDIDHFKKVNDEHGHQAGDAVLREVARLLKDTVRAVDSVGRYGGEEFLVVLPHTNREAAVLLAERLRRRVESHIFAAAGKELRVTLSLGVATYPSRQVDSPNALIREADQALYRAKLAGRNQVA